MKLLRVGKPGAERLAVADDAGVIRELPSALGDITPAFLAGGGIAAAREAATDHTLPIIDGGERVGPPVTRPSKIVCIGLNYSDHAAETGAPEPAEPVVFMKAPNTVIGPDDTVLVPRGSERTDWEVELAVVIGETARYLPDADAALRCVAGYCVANDVSERSFQLERGGQWDKGKSCETFNPLGPYLVTPDEIGDPQNLAMRLAVNGVPRQDSNTANMIFGVAEIIRYLSQFMVLEPGDVVNTGTPAGVALGQPDPKPYLRAGDVIELEISGLGRQRQRVGQA